MPETPPRTIGRYEIRRELGRGTMGIVYEATDPELGRAIALKTVRIGFTLSPDERDLFVKRFLAEARIAARLSHPGIVMVHDVGFDSATGAPYIALELLQGRTLAEVIETTAGPLPWRDALRLISRVARALHHAHAHGIVHRDVKPANIMVLPSGEPKLMDFGIAKTETARIKLTAAGQFFGTPLYMAPEQALGKAVDGRADLFSLGSIAYTLITGRNAFAAENIARIVARVVHDEPVPPRQVVAELPADVDHLLARALAKDPAGRYPDGRSLAEDAEDVLAGAPPRHRVGGSSPTEGELDLERLMLGHAGRAFAPPRPDLDAQLEKLVPSDPAGPARSDEASDPPPRPGWSWQRKTVRAATGLVLAALVVVALLLARRVSPLWPDAARSTTAPELRAESSHLDLVVEHSLKDGTLRVWVDRRLVLEQNLDGRARRMTTTLDLEPGGHDVEVQLAWDDKEKTERIRGDFRAGATRRLRAKLGGLLLLKSLSLEWE
jgi:serine/threonine protein kinase